MIYSIILLVLLVFSYYQWKTYSYWRKRGIPGPTPIPILGNYGYIFFGIKSEINYLTEIYYQYPKKKYIGIYVGMKPALLIRDPNMIKQIFTKESDKFQDRFVTDAAKPFKKGLFISSGDDWWILNSSIANFFTKHQLKNVAKLIESPVHEYINNLEVKTRKNNNVELCSFMQCCITAIVWNVVMGYEDVNVKNRLQQMSMLSNSVENFRNSRVLGGITIVSKIVSPICNLLYKGIRFWASKSLSQYIKEAQNLSHENSLLSVLVKIKENTSGHLSKIRKGKKVVLETDDEYIVSNIFTVSAAAYVSLGITIVCLIYELAKNPEIQEKCYNDVKEAQLQHDQSLNWEVVSKMSYLEMAVKETLRKYSALVIDRECSATYQYSGTNLIIEKGVYVIVAVKTMQNDHKYFKHPDKFDPERFSAENIQNINTGVYLPFGAGPRNCIGKNFSVMTMMIVAAEILNKFKCSLSDLSVKQIEMDPNLRVHNILGDVWIKMEKRDYECT